MGSAYTRRELAKPMPELPEVETIRQDLRRKILSQKIKNVIINSDKVAGGKKARQELVNFLPGQSFAEVERIGKLLILEIKESPLFLLVHLKMTGQLIYAFHNQIIAGGHSFSPFPLSAVTTPSVLPLAKREKLSPSAREGARGEREQFLLPDKHTQVMITFENGGQLYFNDMRRFGYFKLADQATKEKIVASFGIEPLTKNFTLEAFPLLFKKRKTLLKALLLNQQLIAGIGNIYADEICHAAKVRPTRRVNTLTQEEI